MNFKCYKKIVYIQIFSKYSLNNGSQYLYCRVPFGILTMDNCMAKHLN